NGRDADFLSVGEARGTGTATSSFSFSGGLDLHRFFEATGIVLPLTFNFSQNSARPRFSAGDDIIRGGADLPPRQTVPDSRSWALSYSRAWSDRSNPLLRYTLGGITASYGTGNNHARDPATSQRSTSSSGSVSYSSALRSLLALPMPYLRARLFPLPER